MKNMTVVESQVIVFVEEGVVLFLEFLAGDVAAGLLRLPIIRWTIHEFENGLFVGRVIFGDEVVGGVELGDGLEDVVVGGGGLFTGVHHFLLLYSFLCRL